MSDQIFEWTQVISGLGSEPEEPQDQVEWFWNAISPPKSRQDRLRVLCSQGIPPSIRHLVWPFLAAREPQKISLEEIGQAASLSRQDLAATFQRLSQYCRCLTSKPPQSMSSAQVPAIQSVVPTTEEEQAIRVPSPPRKKGERVDEDDLDGSQLYWSLEEKDEVDDAEKIDDDDPWLMIDIERRLDKKFHPGTQGQASLTTDIINYSLGWIGVLAPLGWFDPLDDQKTSESSSIGQIEAPVETNRIATEEEATSGGGDTSSTGASSGDSSAPAVAAPAAIAIMLADASTGPLASSLLWIEDAVFMTSTIQILKDIPRTFPKQPEFFTDGELVQPLYQLLMMHVRRNPTLGYVQGMSFLAGMTLLQLKNLRSGKECGCQTLCAGPGEDVLDAETRHLQHSYVLFDQLVSTDILHVLFEMQMPGLARYLWVYQRLFKGALPELYQHFKKHGIEAEVYIIPWILTLYTRSLPMEIAARVWDSAIFYATGPAASARLAIFIFRVALGLLRLLRGQLLKLNFERCILLLQHLPKEVLCSEGQDGQALFNAISQVKISERRINHLLKLSVSAVRN